MLQNQQVAVERAGQGLLHPSLCYDGLCHVKVVHLHPSTPYSFRLRARNAQGWSNFSHVTDYVTTGPYDLPPSPLGPTLQSFSESTSAITIRVGLAANKRPLTPPITSYEAQIRPRGTDVWQSLPSVLAVEGISWATITALGLQPNTTYYFRVRAVNDAGAGPYSAISAPLTTLGYSIMPSILPPFLRAGNNVTASAIEISWFPASLSERGSVRYDLRYRHSLGEPWEEMEDIEPSSVEGTVLTYLVEGLKPYTPYVFQVRQWWSKSRSSSFLLPPQDGVWSNSSEPIWTLDGLESFVYERPPVESTEETFLVTSSFDQIAHDTDGDYVYGVAVSGVMAQAGGDGMVAITYHIHGRPEPSTTYFFKTGAPQTYEVPSSIAPGSWPGYITIKAWGAGGGGSRGDPESGLAVSNDTGEWSEMAAHEGTMCPKCFETLDALALQVSSVMVLLGALHRHGYGLILVID